MKSSVIDLQPAIHITGIVVLCLAGAMLVPATLDIVDGHRDAGVMFGTAGFAGFVGGMMMLSTRGSLGELRTRDGVIAALLVWIGAAFVGALPFWMKAGPLGFTDGLFEAVSGLTATGSTVFVDLDHAPRGILLWRFLLIWLGGFGLVTFATLVLPYLRVGGLQFFAMDLSARPGKFLPRIAQVTALMAAVYVILTLLCTAGFYSFGMNGFDALGHAMAAIATGGFSSHDNGFAYWNSASLELTAALFMTLSAMPFALFVPLLRGNWRPLWRESQVRLFVLMVAAAILLLMLWRMLQFGVAPFQAFREAAFNLTSMVSTTGFTSTEQDFSQWGGFATLLLVTAMLVGGCTGSTAGGIKAFRLVVLLEAARTQIARQILPSIVTNPVYNGAPVPPGVLNGVIVYFFVYIITVGLLSLTLGLFGLAFDEAVSAAATSLGGVGPGIGPRIGPCCTFATIPDGAKYAMMVGMLAGRLEILLLVLPFTRLFWRS